MTRSKVPAQASGASTRFFGALLAVALALPPVGPALGQKAASPFEGLEGTWSGAGTVTSTKGETLPLRCRATYRILNQGSYLEQTLQCAAPRFTFNVATNASASGSDLSGSWSEATLGVAGTIAGSAKPGSIRATVGGTGFTVSVSIALRGNQQIVDIRPHGSNIATIAMNMRRGE